MKNVKYNRIQAEFLDCLLIISEFNVNISNWSLFVDTSGNIPIIMIDRKMVHEWRGQNHWKKVALSKMITGIQVRNTASYPDLPINQTSYRSGRIRHQLHRLKSQSVCCLILFQMLTRSMQDCFKSLSEPAKACQVSGSDADLVSAGCIRRRTVKPWRNPNCLAVENGRVFEK